MARPKAVKIKRGNIETISKFDQASYSVRELSRAAQYDTAKLVRKRVVNELKKLPGMRRSKRIYGSTQYWVRARELDLQIGFKHGTWYGVDQELGSKNQPKRGVLKGTVMKSIIDIRRIQGAYLSAIENENKAQGLINEDEYRSPEGRE